MLTGSWVEAGTVTGGVKSGKGALFCLKELRNFRFRNVQPILIECFCTLMPGTFSLVVLTRYTENLRSRNSWLKLAYKPLLNIEGISIWQSRALGVLGQKRFLSFTLGFFNMVLLSRKSLNVKGRIKPPYGRCPTIYTIEPRISQTFYLVALKMSPGSLKLKYQ